MLNANEFELVNNYIGLCDDKHQEFKMWHRNEIEKSADYLELWGRLITARTYLEKAINETDDETINIYLSNASESTMRVFLMERKKIANIIPNTDYYLTFIDLVGELHNIIAKLSQESRANNGRG